VYFGLGTPGIPDVLLSLRLDRGSLVVQYGAAQFDGCGADSARPTEVNGEPALINSLSGYSEIIWPATKRHPVGRYGLSGPFSASKITALAESMHRIIERTLAAQANC
jgi:hypothetical protein